MPLTPEDRARWERIHQNHLKLEACPLHDFEKIGSEPGDATYRCKNCGGTLRYLHGVSWYNKGLAHGKGT